MKKIDVLSMTAIICSLLIQPLFAQNTNAGTGSGTLGSYNSFFGYYSGNAAQSGSGYNNGFGANSLKLTTTGVHDVALGYSALLNNTTGNYNVAIGSYALQTNSTSTYSVAVGYASQSLNTVGWNTSVGHQTLNNSTSGQYNVALGMNSMSGNTTGSSNTAAGFKSLFSATTASANTAFGFQALYGVTGQNNTGIGYTALNAASSGSDNTAMGYSAMQNNTGSYNAALGSSALFSNSSGGNNTAIGFHTLYANTTGTNNTALGYNADVASGALTNATAIGNGASATASNAVQLGNSAVTQVFAGTGTTATLIAGGLKITGGTLGAGKVLTSDANGVATWQTPSGGGSQWTTSGSNIYYNTGTVGVGTTTPNSSYKIDVNGIVNATGLYVNGAPYVGSQWTTSGANVYWNGTGYIGIGSTNPDYKLTVNGTVHCSEVKVDVNIPPDYVFEKDYKLLTLEEVKKYIDENKHLPEIPSAKEMEKNGVQVGEMNMLLLKKVEELTLHLIDLKKENEDIKKENERLKERVLAIENRK